MTKEKKTKKAKRETAEYGSRNNLEILGDALERQRKKKIKETKEYWKNVTNKDLPCKNAKYKKFGKSIRDRYSTKNFPEGREIHCKITKRPCVCSLFKIEHYGSFMNQNYRDCPGFKERHAKKKTNDKDT